MANFLDLVQSETPVLVDFHATWCQPCHMLAPVLQNLARVNGDRLKIIKIDIDQHQALAQHLNITGVPTLMLYQNGELKWRQSGVVPQHVLQEKIQPYFQSES
jgi:thioredoxin 1